MKTIEEQLAKYAEYHRDRRNIVTHFIGIPMIVLAVQVLLSRPVFFAEPFPMTAALVISVLTAIYYLLLDRPLGLLMAVVLAIGLVLSNAAAAQSTSTWLWFGLGLFIVGWVIQFVGHIYEGRKPAFVDDIIGLIIGPLFVAAELLFLMGLRQDLQHAIEKKAGATRVGRTPATS